MADEFQDLVQRLRTGERTAWTTLVERYSPLVWRILAKFDPLTSAEREDLFQEVFVALLSRGLHAFRGSTEHEFRAYLKIITENETRSRLRKHSRRFEVTYSFLAEPDADEPALPVALDDPTPGPEAQALEQEALDKLRLCLQAIPLLDQEIFWMRERACSYQEIVKLLNIPLGTVASKYDRAKKKIEACLKAAGIL